ncbi:MAG TPA: hypothetical protein PKB10_01145 [Tepidisphaeraceae bacterium]|nr:hypothetical protein [Tepidisphaeraceae bacterium]
MSDASNVPPKPGSGPQGISHEKPYREFALSIKPDSFDPEHKVNRFLVQSQKLGSIAPLLHVNTEERWAMVSLPAVSATMKVPFGWHVIDDGRRALMFDADGHIQINFSFIPGDGRSVDELIEQTRLEITKDDPKLQSLVQPLGDMKLLCVTDLQVDGKPVDVCWLISNSPIAEGAFLQARLTAPADHMTRAMDLFELLMTGFQFLVLPAGPDAAPPA